MKITAQEIITEVAKSFFIKRDKVIGPVMDVYREIPRMTVTLNMRRSIRWLRILGAGYQEW